jgi:hypothetical protein
MRSVRIGLVSLMTRLSLARLMRFAHVTPRAMRSVRIGLVTLMKRFSLARLMRFAHVTPRAIRSVQIAQQPSFLLLVQKHKY